MSYSERFESLTEARIRAARKSGEFDDLPGAGKPVPGKGEPYDLNARVDDYHRRPTEPYIKVKPADPGEVVRNWREARAR